MGKVDRIEPLSYLQANAEQAVRELAERGPLIVTEDGEARAVLQDIASYKATQETLAMMKLLAMSRRDIAEGRVSPLEDVAARLRAKFPGTAAPE